MKIPTGGTGNGYYGHDSSVISYLSENSEVANGEATVSPTIEGDFSEYMWMENEEEFDKQVMQQLEEEALMEQCIEAMLEDEREIRNIHNQAMASNGVSTSSTSEPRQPWSTGTGSDFGTTSSSISNASDLCQTMENLSVRDELAKDSTLNPDAAEFVPSRSLPRSTGPVPLHPKTS